MEDKIADGRPTADDSKPVTFDEAERMGAFAGIPMGRAMRILLCAI
jgi:hypothetical protein